MSDAIFYANEGDIIELLADNYIFTPLTISADKDFSIYTEDFDIILGNPITNNGKVYIKGRGTIKYHYSDYALINATGGELGLAGISLDVNYGVENNGTLDLSDISIEASGTAIKNTSTLTTQNNITLTGVNSYSIYNDGGEASIANAAISGRYIYNNAGTLRLTNSTATRPTSTISLVDYIVNKGTLELTSSSVALTNINPQSGTYSGNDNHRALYNTGSVTITDTTVSHLFEASSNVLRTDYSTLYNDGGSILISDSTILFDGTNASPSSNSNKTAYAIYSPSGSVTIETGSIINRNRTPSYGIYTNSGTITIGIPEPSSSPNYGRDTADVSRTSPEITAINLNTNNSYKSAIGVKNTSGGKVYFYDGKVSGSTTAFAENPTGTEYQYEVCNSTDTSVTPNLYTAQLFWMRDGQSSCAQQNN